MGTGLESISRGLKVKVCRYASGGAIVPSPGTVILGTPVGIAIEDAAGARNFFPWANILYVSFDDPLVHAATKVTFDMATGPDGILDPRGFFGRTVTAFGTFEGHGEIQLKGRVVSAGDVGLVLAKPTSKSAALGNYAAIPFSAAVRIQFN